MAENFQTTDRYHTTVSAGLTKPRQKKIIKKTIVMQVGVKLLKTRKEKNSKAPDETDIQGVG